MTEQIPNGLNSDLPIYWRDLSGINYNINLDETYYGQTKHYFTTASHANFMLLSNYDWNLGDPCGEGLFGEMSVHLNNFFNFLRGIQQYSNTYIVGSINMVQNLAGQITKVSEAIAGILRTLIQRVRNWILNQIRSLIDSALESVLTPLTKQIKEGVLQGVIEQLICALDNIIDGLVDFVGDFLYALVGQIIQAPLCAAENYLNAMLNRLSSDIENALQPALNSLNDVLGGVLSVVGQINSVIGQILGYEAFFCSRPECPEVKNFKASIWGGPTPSAIANFQNFTAASSSLLANTQASAEEWLSDFFGPNSNTSQSVGNCYTGTFQCGIPQVVIFGGGGSGAVGNAVVNAVGEIIGVNLLNGGSGYTSPPFVSISDPGGCGVNASASAILCPPTPSTSTTNSNANANVISGYTSPGIYLNLVNASNGIAPQGFNGPGIYLDLTNSTGINTAGTVPITLTVTKESGSTYNVSIPGNTSSGNPIPALPQPAQNNVPVQLSFNLTAGRIYGPITNNPVLAPAPAPLAGIIGQASNNSTIITGISAANIALIAALPGGGVGAAINNFTGTVVGSGYTVPANTTIAAVNNVANTITLSASATGFGPTSVSFGVTATAAPAAPTVNNVLGISTNNNTLITGLTAANIAAIASLPSGGIGAVVSNFVGGGYTLAANTTITAINNVANTITLSAAPAGNVPGPVASSFNVTGAAPAAPVALGTLYIGNQTVPNITGSGSLTNQSIVIAEGSDDWNDYVVTTSEGVFVTHTTPPQAPSSSTANAGNISVLFTRQATTPNSVISFPKTSSSSANPNIVNLGGPAVAGNVVSSLTTLTAGRLYGPFTISSGSGTLYVGDETVTGISSSGSLPNTSIVIEDGGDDWDDMVLSTSHGFFANYTSAPLASNSSSSSSSSSSNSSSATSSVCQIVINNPGNNYNNTANNGAPVINSFTGTPNPITQNNTITLSWDVTNATSVSLNVTGFNNLPLNGNASFLANATFPNGIQQTTITYTLTATNNQANSAAQTTTRDFIVTVNQAAAAAAAAAAAGANTNTPTINSFSASPTTLGIGSVVTLTWDTTNASFCSLTASNSNYSINGYSSIPDDGTLSFVIPPNLTFPAAGTAPIDYTLTATNLNAPTGSQTSTSTVTINVNPLPVVAAAATAVGVGSTAAAAAAVGLFTCTPSVTTLNEGDSIDFTVTSTDPADNGTFHYEIVRNFGSLTASDFTDNTLTGSFTIANNTGLITKTIAIDANVESLEEFYLGIKRNQADNVFLARTGTITINADTVAAAAVPAVAQIANVVPINSGNNYSPNTQLVASNGAVLSPVINPSGQIVAVNVVNPGYGFTRIPEIEINSREGLGAKFRVDLKFTPVKQFLKEQKLKSISQDKIVKIIDCVSR